jgi:primosomal protein N' (replication factor Y)
VTEKKTYFVDVILPLSLAQVYTYRIPADLNEAVKVGCRAIAQFGKNKYYSVLIIAVHENPPQKYTAKYIDSVLDNEPVVNTTQLKLWKWMAEYYMCTVGEMMIAAMPSGLKLSSETKLVKNTAAEIDSKFLTDDEFLIAEALTLRDFITIEDVQEILNRKTVHHVMRALIEKNVLLVYEDIKEKYKPKIKQHVQLSAQYSNQEQLKDTLDLLEKKSEKQLDLLMCYLRMGNSALDFKICKTDLLKAASSTDAVLNSLCKKNIFEITKEETDRINFDGTTVQSKQLNTEQAGALQNITETFNSKDIVLLHGVTSSGKTEVYIKQIESEIAKGKQVLYLLPEIALTTQIISRLQKHFGDKVGVYHSRYNESERVEVWKNVLKHNSSSGFAKCQIILGARSSVFLPFSDLGLVIVDEEHDVSYKQHDPAPRYNARDTAIYLAHLHGAKTILGSATPSIETYYNAQQNKFGLVELKTRYGNAAMPQIITADVKQAANKKEMKSHFTPALIDEIGMTLKRKEQAIIFQNRRGFAPMLSCQTCEWVPQCVQCDVSLTYHKNTNQLKCHYCGYTAKLPTHCSACGSDNLKLLGFGTEKIEEELFIFFPDAKIARMDLDSTRSKNAYKQIINDFEERHIDILVGTQMVTKGLDFDNVSLVGVMNADAMLNFPDYHSFERSFQLMEQVSGRAGRKNTKGKVIIQTGQPNHHVLDLVKNHDYNGFYTIELEHRKNFLYPPFCRIVEITLQHKDYNYLDAASAEFTDNLKQKLDTNVLGPAAPLVGKVKNYYLKSVIVKLGRDINITEVKQFIRQTAIDLNSKSEFKSLRIVFDVDPL